MSAVACVAGSGNLTRLSEIRERWPRPAMEEGRSRIPSLLYVNKVPFTRDI